jgi:hypothetical protein
VALELKLNPLYTRYDRLSPVQQKVAGVTANIIISLIDRLKGKNASPLPPRCSQIEANTNKALAFIALKEETEESAKRAVAHLQKALDLYEAIGSTSSAAIIKSNLVLARSMYEVVNHEELVKAPHDVYKLRVTKLGGKHEDTIHAGQIYAFHLLKANRNAEARELLTKLLTTSKQVLDSHHRTTMDVASQLQFVSMQLEGEYAIELLQDYRGAEATELLTKVLAWLHLIFRPSLWIQICAIRSLLPSKGVRSHCRLFSSSSSE